MRGDRQASRPDRAAPGARARCNRLVDDGGRQYGVGRGREGQEASVRVVPDVETAHEFSKLFNRYVKIGVDTNEELSSEDLAKGHKPDTDMLLEDFCLGSWRLCAALS